MALLRRTAHETLDDAGRLYFTATSGECITVEVVSQQNGETAVVLDSPSGTDLVSTLVDKTATYAVDAPETGRYRLCVIPADSARVTATVTKKP